MQFILFLKWKKDPQFSDEEIVERYRFSHDTKYITELFGRYSTVISAICLKYLKSEQDAEDAAMDIYQVMIKDLKLHSVQNFRGWIGMVSRNHCLKKLEKIRKTDNRSISIEDAENIFMESDPFGDLSEKVAKENQIQLMLQAIDKLNEKQKKCIELFYLKKKTYQDICEETGYTMKEVKSNIQNGKRNLKISLESKGGEEK